MTDQSVFGNPDDNSGQPAQQQPAQSSPFADQLSGIKNEEGKQKYDTIEKALEGLSNAQSYIPQLKDQVSTQEAEINRLKAQLDQRESVEEVVSRLAAPQQPSQEPQLTSQVPSGLTEEQVTQIVQNTFVQNQQQQVEVTNKTKVNSELIAKFGEKAGEVVNEKAKSLNTTPQQLEQMAATNPDMVLALFNSSTNTSVKPSTGSINIQPSNQGEPEPLQPPEKSLLSGATGKDQKDYMLKIKEEVYRKYGVVQ